MRPLSSVLRSSLAVAAAVSVAACSGGGGGAGGSGGGLTLSPTSLTFSAVQGGPAPQSLAVQVSIDANDAAYVVAGYPPGTTQPAWMDADLSGSGATWHLAISITQTNLSPGTYTATLRVVIARADQSIIGYRDVKVTYTVSAGLTASPAALAFTHVLGGPTETKQVAVGGTAGGTWTAVASESWVTLDRSSATTPSTVVVGFDPTGLAPGSYTANVTFSGVGQTASVALTLTVRAPALVVSATALPFSGVNGASFAAQALDVSLDNGAAVQWTATTGASWIVLDKATGTTPDRLAVGVDPSRGPLAAGAYSAPVTVSASWGGSTLTATVDVQLTLTKASFSVPATLVLGGADGRDLTAKPVQLALNTGASAYPWSATWSEGWMSLPVAAGNASSTPVTVDVVPDRTGLVGGTRTGTIAFSAIVNGDTITASLPVTFNLEAHRVLVSREGVALTSTPGVSRLTRTLRVTDSLGTAAPWSATADQPWLTVTQSGTPDADLVLTADPAGLAADTLHLARITISSSDPTVENTEIVRVGLWVGSVAPAATLSVPTAFNEVVADPVRPYAYVHSAGSDLSVYNIHTGAKVATIAAVAGSLGGMTVSGDGSTLYAIDKATWKLVPVDLDSRSIGLSVTLASTSNTYPRVSWTRTNGQPILIVTDGTVRDAIDGSVLASFGSSFLDSSTKVATSLDGSVFCALGCRSLAYSALGGGTLSLANRQGVLGSHDGALGPDGSVVYRASGAPYQWDGYSTLTGLKVIQLGSSLPYPGNVDVGWDGRIYCGRYSASSADDVFVFDAAGVQRSSFRVAGPSLSNLRDDEMVLSGDGLRILALTSEYYAPFGALKFVTIP